MRKPATFLLHFMSVLLLPAQIPADGLVAYWPFDGNFEEAGPHRLYSYSYGAGLAEDRFGMPDRALLLDSFHTCVVTPDHPKLHVHSFSWSFWMRVEQVIDPYVAIIAKRTEKPDNRFSIDIYSRHGSLNSFLCNQEGEESYVRSSLWIPKLRTWHHIAVTGDYHLMDYSIYADGIRIGREDLNVTQFYDGNPLTFGNMMFHGYTEQPAFVGRLDDIRLYDRALTAQEVQALAADQRDEKPLGLDWMMKDLPDGRYLALYTEQNKTISPRPFVFDLARSRPIWQNAGFVAGCLLITCCLTIWALRARHTRTNRLRQTELAKLKAIEQERSRIARDLHDDLGSGLSAIGLLTEIARQKSTDPARDVEIQKIAVTSTELSRKIREIIWLVSARFDNLNSLTSYVNHFAVELFADAPTELEVRLPPHIPAMALSGEHRRAYFQAIKIALLKIQHAAPDRVVLAFSINTPLETTVQYTGSDVFSPELDQPSAFSLAVEKLKEHGSDFYLQKDIDIILHFVLPAVQ